jgi:hypothetical protein
VSRFLVGFLFLQGIAELPHEVFEFVGVLPRLLAPLFFGQLKRTVANPLKALKLRRYHALVPDAWFVRAESLFTWRPKSNPSLTKQRNTTE